MTTPSTPSSSQTPATGFKAIASAAGSAAGTVGAIAAATQSQPKLSLALGALAAIFAFLGAFARAPNTVRVP